MQKKKKTGGNLHVSSVIINEDDALKTLRSLYGSEEEEEKSRENEVDNAGYEADVSDDVVHDYNINETVNDVVHESKNVADMNVEFDMNMNEAEVEMNDEDEVNDDIIIETIMENVVKEEVDDDASVKIVNDDEMADALSDNTAEAGGETEEVVISCETVILTDKTE